MAGKDDDAASGNTTRFLGSLRDALAAASKDDNSRPSREAAKPAQSGDAAAADKPPPVPEETAAHTEELEPTAPHSPPSPSAADAAREARGGTPNVPPVAASGAGGDRHIEFDAPPTTRVVREEEKSVASEEQARTQMLRGKQQVKRGEFFQDPVVGWLVIVGGPGLGAYRPIFEGNNTLGRNSNQRIPIDFGDDAISAEEQCYIRYDSGGRTFLFVPNLAKANVVSLNETRPTGAVALSAMDVITVGRTQLVFVPFCGSEFDWGDLDQSKD